MTQRPRTAIAIYDLDRTITSIPTWTPFLLFTAWKLAPWRLALIPFVGVAALGRAIGVHDRDRLKESMHRWLLGPTLDPAQLAVIAERFAAAMMRDRIRPGARASLEADRQDGRRIVIATAAHRFYAAAIARRLGIADLIATEASTDPSGRIVPALSGANCYGAAKQRMIAAWLADQGIDRDTADIRFYSDHISDVPTFAWVDTPVVVNADTQLRAVARQRGWRSVDWRTVGD